MRNKDGNEIDPLMKSLLSQENILNIFPRAKGIKLFSMISLYLQRIDERGVDWKQADQQAQRSMTNLGKSGLGMPGYGLCPAFCSFSLPFLSSGQQSLVWYQLSARHHASSRIPTPSSQTQHCCPLSAVMQRKINKVHRFPKLVLSTQGESLNPSEFSFPDVSIILQLLQEAIVGIKYKVYKNFKSHKYFIQMIYFLLFIFHVLQFFSYSF